MTPYVTLTLAYGQAFRYDSLYLMSVLSDPAINPFWPPIPTTPKTRAVLRQMMRRDKELARRWAAPWVRLALEHFGGYDSLWLARDWGRQLESLGCPEPIVKTAALGAWRSNKWRMENGVKTWQRQPDYVATPYVATERSYRSKYEQRVADSLTRLGVAFSYESHTFDYVDARGATHNYTPDFSLDDLHMTFIEVKGIHGRTNADKVKHSHVLRRHSLTLLLWDAQVIDMVEQMQSPSELVGLLETTKL